MLKKTIICVMVMLLASASLLHARDLAEIKASGKLLHLGIPYANFVNGQGEGLDVEIIKAFCAHIGVSYEYVQEDWATSIPDLIGKTFKLEQGKAVITGTTPIKGDLLANGLTILNWRKDILSYSMPTFPTQVWLVVGHKSPITPITPTGDINQDIKLTHEKLKGMHVLCRSGTCLDPRLFDLSGAGATARDFEGSLNDLAPAVIMGEADATLLDVPDALVALQKFPGKIKIIGPITDRQKMAVGFRKDQPNLLKAFNEFFTQLRASGQYDVLVHKYYPLAYTYFPEFFAK